MLDEQEDLAKFAASSAISGDTNPPWLLPLIRGSMDKRSCNRKAFAASVTVVGHFRRGPFAFWRGGRRTAGELKLNTATRLCHKFSVPLRQGSTLAPSRL